MVLLSFDGSKCGIRVGKKGLGILGMDKYSGVLLGAAAGWSRVLVRRNCCFSAAFDSFAVKV